METQATTPNANDAHPVFMTASGGDETHLATTIDHDGAVERPPVEGESQKEITDTPGKTQRWGLKENPKTVQKS